MIINISLKFIKDQNGHRIELVNKANSTKYVNLAKPKKPNNLNPTKQHRLRLHAHKLLHLLHQQILIPLRRNQHHHQLEYLGTTCVG